VTIFLLATLFHDRVLGGKTPVRPPAGFVQGGDARARVHVLAALGGDGVRAVLLPLREDGAPAEAEGAAFDRDLFPGSAPRRWARLLVANPPGRAPFTLDLRPGSVTLEAAAGPSPNEDLAEAVVARLQGLSPHRLLDLRVSHAADSAVEVPPAGFVRVVVAFPGGAGLEAATGASLAGGPHLLPREVSVERIRAVLLDGRIDDILDAERDLAKGRGASGAKR
jgi:hypothetical protein